MIDVHAHAMPMPVLEWLAGQGLADLSEVDRQASSGIIRLDPRVSGVAAGTPLPLARSQWDVGDRLAQMDAAGVDVHAVSLPPFLICSTAEDADLAREVIRRGNDALLVYAATSPSRLLALGSVPLGTDGASEEAARCLVAGARGIAIGTRGAGRELDDPIHEPLWQLLAERNVFTFLHPSGVPDAPRLRDYYLPQLIGYPMETAIAVTRLVMSGVRQRWDFPLCLAHGGGCLPWLGGRLDLGWERKEVARTTPTPPSSYLDGLHYDTAVFSPRLLADLIELVGIDQVMIGTDTPFELADRDPRATLAALDLSDDDRARIAWANASRLLGLPWEGR